MEKNKILEMEINLENQKKIFDEKMAENDAISAKMQETMNKVLATVKDSAEKENLQKYIEDLIAYLKTFDDKEDMITKLESLLSSIK